MRIEPYHFMSHFFGIIFNYPFFFDILADYFQIIPILATGSIPTHTNIIEEPC